jgi:dUTP pyrophosphatase
LFYDSSQEAVIPAKGKVIVPTDISIALPEGTYGRVAPRSGLAVKHFLDVGAGVVDSDYRGPLGVVMFNFSEQDFQGKPLLYIIYIYIYIIYSL